MMTKRRIHTFYFALCPVYTVFATIGTVFFLRDFSKEDRCRLFTILTKTAYLAIPVLLFSLGSAVMLFNYVIIIFNLMRSKKPMRDITIGTNVKIPKNNVKLTRAIIMTLTAYILFYIPVVAVTSIGIIFNTFLSNSLRDTLEDVCLLLYFTNNLINPFIYSLTLRDFRDGYNRLLFCCVWRPVKRNSNVTVAVI